MNEAYNTVEINKTTLWETRVLVENNNLTDSDLDKIKIIRERCAELIDLLENDFKKHNEFNPEIKRVYANAQTEIENSCMWSIKAISKKSY